MPYPAKLICGCLLILLIACALFTLQSSYAANPKPQTLSFEDRVTAQRAIEAVYWRHRIWSKDNPQPKPTLEEVLPEAALRSKVEQYLRQSQELEIYYQRPISAAELQAELERMARNTRQPQVLRELWADLDNNPLLVAECLARPLVVAREWQQLWGKDESGRMKDEPRMQPLPSFFPPQPFDYRLPVITTATVPCGNDNWTATSSIGAPDARSNHVAIWTGSEMIIWGGRNVNLLLNTGGRYLPALDAWGATAMTGAPSFREYHSAVWTGSEVLIWGGAGINNSRLNTGSRYNPLTDTWSAISTLGAASPRVGHTAVWTGSEMLIWGGSDSKYLNTGSRYNPTKDSWSTINQTGAPTERGVHTALWIGSEMLIWGGNSGNNDITLLNTGGRYNPIADSWKTISNVNAPSVRRYHTSVWTGDEMIVWGGEGSNISYLNSGGRYNSASDSWTFVNPNGAPSPRENHVAVWASSEMVIWSGNTNGPNFNTGGRYNPALDSWENTSVSGAPEARSFATAVWTGSEMIVWGGYNTNKGGRYSFAPALTLSQVTPFFTAVGGDGNITISALGGCTWTASSNANWLIITSGNSGAGNGPVNFSVAANTSGSPRTAVVTINTRTVMITQAGDNPVPTLVSLSPTSVLAGGPAFTLNLTGANFVNVSAIRWNGANRITTFVNNAQLTAQILATDLLTLGAASITVFNPAPGGGTSNALSFTLNSSVSSISAASFSGTQVAPESIVAAFGTGLATQTLTASIVPLPSTLAGTSVKVRDSVGVERLAPLFFVAPQQINYLIPVGTATGVGTIIVTSGDGKQSIGAVQIAAVAPALFAANANGQGVAAAVALRVKPEGTQSFEPVAQFNSATGRFVTTPIDLGAANEQVFLLLFGSGIRGRSALTAVTCQIGGTIVPVSFAGAQGGFVGLDQINIGQLPRTLAGRGEVDLVLTVDGKVANTVRIAIK
jgi:uncharacterized protein (TIGR03437 family)